MGKSCRVHEVHREMEVAKVNVDNLHRIFSYFLLIHREELLKHVLHQKGKVERSNEKCAKAKEKRDLILSKLRGNISEQTYER